MRTSHLQPGNATSNLTSQLIPTHKPGRTPPTLWICSRPSMFYIEDGNLSFNFILQSTFILSSSWISSLAAYGIFIFVTDFEL